MLKKVERRAMFVERARSIASDVLAATVLIAAMAWLDRPRDRSPWEGWY